jgi:hypothetical protein
MYYGHYNEEGVYIGFYTKDIHGENIAEPNVKLNETEWREALTSDFKVINGLHTKFKEPGPDEMTLLKSMRSDRNGLLSQSDWTQFTDVTLSEDKRLEWNQYRQALRDLPDNIDLYNQIFPDKPL